MKDLQQKFLMVLIALVISMVGWYLCRLTTQIDTLTEEVYRLRIAVEVSVGGNPFLEEDP